MVNAAASYGQCLLTLERRFCFTATGIGWLALGPTGNNFKVKLGGGRPSQTVHLSFRS